MGYSYTMSGALCCDCCGGTPARKIRCPHGWCPPTASCKACAPKVRALDHSSCAIASLAAAERDAQERAILDAGGLLRCSALVAGVNGVHVLFRDRTQAIAAAYYMAGEVYDAIPHGDPATPDDYRAHGPIRPAPLAFDFNGCNATELTPSPDDAPEPPRLAPHRPLFTTLAANCLAQKQASLFDADPADPADFNLA